MRTQTTVRTRIFRSIPWMPIVLLGLLVSTGGCLSLRDMGMEKPNPEIAIQTAEYGTITQITSALMKDNEIRWGDIAITVDTDDGRIVIVTQPEDDIYKVGDRVRVVRADKGFIRVQLVN